MRDVSGGRRLRIDVGPLAEGLTEGDSVAVNGACLTVTALSSAEADFDVIAGTLSRTTLGALRARAKVNLERSLRLGDGLDGHLVQGHVDTVATVHRIDCGGRQEVHFAAPPDATGQMVPKGSVAIDGVSLTLVNVSKEQFSVALIPTTLAETTLGDLEVGREVNVELDLIGKYVRRTLEQIGEAAPGGLSIEKLREAGFA